MLSEPMILLYVCFKIPETVETCSFLAIVRFFTPYIGVWGGMLATDMVPEEPKILS